MEDIKALKKECFLAQVQKGMFSHRIKVTAGNITAQDLENIAELAKKYGRGYVHVTSRQNIEIPFIKLEDIAEVKNATAQMGLSAGACGPKVRHITACQGAAICSNGLIDTTALAQEFDERYFGRQLPHKFKIGITGCRNNCLRTDMNDLGVKGMAAPTWEEKSCTFCGLCEEACKHDALKVDKDGQKILYAEENCKYCCSCVKSCQTGACSKEKGYLLSFGGISGNRVDKGEFLTPIIFSKEKLHEIVEMTLKFFAANTKPGERFRNTLDRIGWESFQKELSFFR